MEFHFDFRPKSFLPNKAIMARLLKLGLPMALQSAAISISMLFVSSFTNSYGVIASAVTGIGTKLGTITSVVTQAIAMADSSMVGQSIGAKKYSRVSRIMGVSYLINLSFAAILSILTIAFPRTIFGMFDSDQAVLDLAMSYIPVAVLLYFGFAMRSPCNGLINGSGNAKLNLLSGLLDGGVCRIGLALLMGSLLGLGIMGYWLGNALAGYVPFIIGMTFFFSGRWKR